MKIEFLGSGGAVTTPNPACDCPICSEARAKEVPYSRMGPSLFIHELNLLIDTPEEIKPQLLRAGVRRVEACLYSHWHPDHVLGMRVFETINSDWFGYPRQNRLTDIYLPQQVALDLETFFNLGASLTYWENILKVIRVHRLSDGDSIQLGNFEIRPFRVAEAYVYAFLLAGEGKRVLIAMDELFGWSPPDWVKGVDLAILPKGLNEFDPFTGERRIPETHPVLKFEATFRQTVEMVQALEAKQVILTHIEETDRLSYADYRRLEEQFQPLNLSFAFDTRVVEV